MNRFPIDARPVALREGETVGPLLELLRRALAVPDGLHPGEAERRRFLFERDADRIPGARLWTDDDGHAYGLAWVSTFLRSAWIVTDPAYPEAEGPVALWTARRIRRATASGTRAGVLVPAGVRDGGRERALGAAGFAPTRMASILLSLSCENAAVDPSEHPSGYSVHSLLAPEELQERADAESRLFPDQPVRAERYCAMMRRGSLYRRDLDLIAMGPDGRIAAFGLFQHDPATRIARAGPVGCLAGNRRLGVASGLVREGVRRLRRLGCLSVRAEVPASIRPDACVPFSFWRSLGFRPVGRRRYWSL
ncbi:MAG: hypothetical protein JW958_13690 [Candidatus Eisenbacteria bacterium]|nr:hypothetical protein [Candidatus Eisenbacteria bacterium]